MKLHAKNPRLFEKISLYISTFVRIVINILLVVLCAVLVYGVIKTGYDFFTLIGQPTEKILPQILVDTVFIIALVEISLMLLSYLKDGKVHVRYIVDTILIVMLNEFVVVWFDKPEPVKVGALIAIILALLIAHVVTNRVQDKKIK